jgi:hypothetical protein
MPRPSRTRLLTAAVLVGSLFALTLPSLVGQGPARGKKYALLVGVDHYRHSGFPRLKGAENDVVELEKLLKKQGFATRLLTTARGQKDAADAPTAANIRKELDKSLSDKGREDTVLIALSGHGAEVEVPHLDDKDKQKPRTITYTYFIPGDGNLEKISHSTGKSDRLIELGELFDRLGTGPRKCGAGAKLVLIDACRNTVLADSSTRGGLDPTNVTVPDGVLALFSCGPGEKSLETGFDVGGGERRIHGVFFWHVIDGLKGKAANQRRGTVNFADLTSYVQDEVPAFVEKLKRKKESEKEQEKKQVPHAFLNSNRPVVLVEPAGKEVKNTIGMELVRIEAGSFLMGSPDADKGAAGDKKAFDDELPRHRVTISKPFYLGKYPVTVGEFRKFVEDEGYKTEAEKDGQGGGGYNEAERKLEDRKPIYTWKKTGWRQTDRHPVVNVTWGDAKAFCRWLSETSLIA